MDESPYTPPKTLGDPAVALWRRRAFALSLTLAVMMIPSLLFTVVVSVPVEHKPGFLLRMLCGPFGSIFPDARFKGDYISPLLITPMAFCYSVHPSCLTFLIAAFGVVCWLGCGFVSATGGV